MTQGNSRTNGISDRKSDSQPNCEHHRDFGHTLAHPTAQLLLKQSADDGGVARGEEHRQPRSGNVRYSRNCSNAAVAVN